MCAKTGLHKLGHTLQNKQDIQKQINSVTQDYILMQAYIHTHTLVHTDLPKDTQTQYRQQTDKKK